MFWFWKTVLPTVFARSVIPPEVTAALLLHRISSHPTAANSLLWGSACSGADGTDGSVRLPSVRFPRWCPLCLFSKRSKEHQILWNSPAVPSLPKQCGICVQNLSWSQHSGRRSAPAYSNFCLCKQHAHSVWYSKCLGIHIFATTLSGETSCRHFQHKCFSKSHHLLFSSLSYTYIIIKFLFKIKTGNIIWTSHNFLPSFDYDGRKRKNSGSRFKNRPRWGFDSLKRLPPHSYFQSLKMSSNAASKAAFRLFYIKARISASRADFFFFFLSFL